MTASDSSTDDKEDVHPKLGATITINAPVRGDPDLKEGGILTLERVDGRKWRQRLVVSAIITVGGVNHYMLMPVADA